MKPMGIAAGQIHARLMELQAEKMNALWQTAQEQWPEIGKSKTRLVFVKKLTVEFTAPEDQYIERITLGPIGNFVMGYGPRANLLAALPAHYPVKKLTPLFHELIGHRLEIRWENVV